MSLNNAHEGYEYQDLLTSYFILKEILLGNKNSIFSVDKKHTTGDTPDRFDDLVITNGSNIQRKQIKVTATEFRHFFENFKIILQIHNSDATMCDQFYF